jgi:hypothetical protein
MHRTVLIAIACGGLLLATNAAHAQSDEGAGSDDARAARLAAVLDYHAAEERGTRRGFGWPLLALGATTLPPGVYLLATGSRSASLAGGELTTLGVGFLSIGTILLATPGSMESLDDEAKVMRAHGRPSDEYLSVVESKWQHAAEGEHSTRRTVGALCLGFGVLGLGMSAWMYVLAYDATPPAPGVYGVAAELTFLGFVDLLLGAHAFATEGPIETAWHAYQRTTNAPTRAREVQASPFVAMVPGGATAGVGAAF